jgi:hypothetical protein|tara:strand:- start:7263 stop:7424 length:162 start_codon:yes stop_codon:yes gene_type:complete
MFSSDARLDEISTSHDAYSMDDLVNKSRRKEKVMAELSAARARRVALFALVEV